MRRFLLATLLLVVAIVGQPLADGAPGTPTASPRSSDAWAVLESAPADLLAFIRLRDGRSLLDAEGGRAMGAALLAALGGEEPASRWQALAARIGWTQEEALRRIVGRDARLALRTDVDGTVDWALLAAVDRDDVDRIVRGLRPTLVPGGRYDLPADRLTFAYRKGWLLVASSPESRLFREFAQPRLPRATGSGLAASLDAAALLPVERREEFLARRIVAVLPLFGGTAGRSVLTADLEQDDRVVVTLRSASADAAARVAGCRGVDAGCVTRIVAALADEALLVMVDPVGGPASTDPLAAVGLGGLRPESLEGTQALRVIAVGECRSQACSPPGCAMKRPAIAVAYEVADAGTARIAQDASVRDACRSLGVDPPSDAERRVELGPVLERVIGRHPLLMGCGLHWRVVERDRCGWQVYATDAIWLDRVSERLADLRSEPRRPPDSAAISSAGRLCGTRIAEHMRTWIAEAPSFAPDRAESFAQGISLIADIGGRLRCVEWTVRRDADRARELTLSARLSPSGER